MNLKELFETDGDGRAVSPVIGVILMVAITVILAAVIGAFVIGIGEDQEVQPTASFNVDFETDKITVSHSTGDTIEDPDSLDITIDGNSEDWIGDEDDSGSGLDDVESISAGSTAEIYAENGDGAPGPSSTEPGEYVIQEDGTGDFQGAISVDDTDDVFEYAGETVSIVWSSETGDSSATLSSQDAPN